MGAQEHGAKACVVGVVVCSCAHRAVRTEVWRGMCGAVGVLVCSCLIQLSACAVHTDSSELPQGHRVSRPRGTGSVGGEGTGDSVRRGRVVHRNRIMEIGLALPSCSIKALYRALLMLQRKPVLMSLCR